MVEVRAWSGRDARRFVRVPGVDDDKYSRGVVGLRTGSEAYPGAAVLSVEAAWRAGAGYVRYDGQVSDAVLARRPETVVGASSARVDAWVLGSGTDAATRTPDETRALVEILAGARPVVVDAGALDLAIGSAAPRVVTPHAREFARLRQRLGLSAPTGADGEVAETAGSLGAVVLLKGARTLIADPDGLTIAVTAGTTWLSTAGTGDVLAGILGALLAANRSGALAEVTAAAAWLHGHAAARAAGAVQGAAGHPIVALDVAQHLPYAIADLLS